MKRLLALLLGLSWAGNIPADQTLDRWWPAQTFPKSIVRTTSQQDFPEPRTALQMMVQSVAGLAAQAVNEGRGDELVWVYNGDGDLEKWYARLVAQNPGLATPGTLAPWELVDRFAKQGVIKGYILYHGDTSVGDNNANRPGMDCSVNVATSVAGLLDGIIVDESLEPAAKAHGLKLLSDVRGKSQLWCFQTYKSQFNRRLVCFQDPRAPHVRDLAIARRVFTAYGSDGSAAQAMHWAAPLSTILGWNCGDEFNNTDESTELGEIQTSSNWSLNLPVLMAGTDDLAPCQLPRFDPRTIDWNDSRSAVTFIDTDGDNLQWIEGNFFGNSDYWADPARGKIPFGWSICADHLAQVCPQALDYAATTRTTDDWFVEWGGGYYYPDRFAMQRSNRWDLLAQHARRTWNLMQKTGTRIIGFNFSQVDSPDAHRACETFAKQTDGLLAILAFQYSPYEAGAGKVFWVTDANGIEVPVITARYCIWEHANARDRAGTPAKVAREIRETVASSSSPRYDWAICHAWSYFKRAPGSDEDAENMPQADAEHHDGIRGYSPALWCAQRLPPNIRVISPEELAWRIRMQHNPAQTKKLISRSQ